VASFKDLPLRRKLVLLLWGMSVSTLVVTATISLVAQVLLSRRQVLQDLEAQAQVLAENLVAAVDFSDAQAADETLQSLAFNRELRVACVYDAQGIVFAAYEPRQRCPDTQTDARTVMDRTSVQVARPIQRGTRVLGHLTLVGSLAAVYRQFAVQLSVIAGLLLVVGALGYVVSRWLESFVSTPVLRLTNAAAKIASGRYDLPSVAVPVASRDEIGQLTQTFNSMVSQLAEQDAALRAANAQLEQRVSERTLELADRNAELTRANQDLEDFAYITSHDLKEPLRGIQHYAGFLAEDYAAVVDDAGKTKLATMARLASRMEALIDSLLHYSRVGQVDISPDPVDLTAVVREVCESLAVTIDQSGASVHVHNLDKTPCDPARAAEVFANLIVNAIKYNDKQTKLVEVGSRRGLAAGPVTYYVLDNGIGIAEKHRDAVFRIFKRLHPRDAYGGGVGAGLTIVRKIVERHGGRVWIESEPTVGTTVYFTLAPER